MDAIDGICKSSIGRVFCIADSTVEDVVSELGAPDSQIENRWKGNGIVSLYSVKRIEACIGASQERTNESKKGNREHYYRMVGGKQVDAIDSMVAEYRMLESNAKWFGQRRGNYDLATKSGTIEIREAEMMQWSSYWQRRANECWLNIRRLRIAQSAVQCPSGTNGEAASCVPSVFSSTDTRS